MQKPLFAYILKLSCMRKYRFAYMTCYASLSWFLILALARTILLVHQSKHGSHYIFGFSPFHWLAVFIWFLTRVLARIPHLVSHTGIGSHTRLGFSRNIWLALLIWFLNNILARSFALVSHNVVGLISCAWPNIAIAYAFGGATPFNLNDISQKCDKNILAAYLSPIACI